MTKKVSFIIDQETDKTHELKKHVALVHTNSALTLIQRKISNALLLHAYPNLRTQEQHEINVKKLCELIGYNSKETRYIKEALLNLLSNVIQFNILDDKDGSEVVWRASSIIADAEIKGPLCKYSFSKTMREYLYHPKTYATLCLKEMAKFKSVYSLALYETCNRYKDIGKTQWLSISKLRQILGIPKEKYTIFRDFKHQVLVKAIIEVNKISSLHIIPKLRKEGAKVTAIQLLIEKKAAFLPEPLDPADIDLIAALKKDINEQYKIQKIINDYDGNLIIDALNKIYKQKAYQDKKIKDFYNYLKKVITKTESIAKEKQKFNKPVGLDTIKISNTFDKKLQQYNYYVNDKLIESFTNLPKNSSEEILTHFKKNIRGGIEWQLDHEGIENPNVRFELAKFLNNQYPQLKKNVVSYDEWLKVELVHGEFS